MALGRELASEPALDGPGIDRVEDRGRGAIDPDPSSPPAWWPWPWADRHPDHVAASKVLSDGVFNAKLRRYDAEGEPWQSEWICFYFINDSTTPSFVVDVSEHYETKRRALACHRTQFTATTRDAVSTRLTSETFSQLIESRDAHFGALVGVRFAEGLIVREPIVRDTLFSETRGTGNPRTSNP